MIDNPPSGGGMEPEASAPEVMRRPGGPAPSCPRCGVATVKTLADEPPARYVYACLKCRVVYEVGGAKKMQTETPAPQTNGTAPDRTPAPADWRELARRDLAKSISNAERAEKVMAEQRHAAEEAHAVLLAAGLGADLPILPWVDADALVCSLCGKRARYPQEVRDVGGRWVHRNTARCVE